MSQLIKLPVLVGCLLICLPVVTVLAANPAKAITKLTFITETYPPYNFVDHGILKGIAVDLLIAATRVQNIKLRRDKIKVYPWTQGYQLLLKGESTVLFSMTRTSARESLFKWAGPIFPARIVLLASKTRQIEIQTNQDMRRYIVGGIQEGMGEQLVLASGYPKDKLISQTSANAVVNRLINNQVDLWAYEEFAAHWLIKQNQLNTSDFESVYLLKESQFYYAFSKDVDNEVIELLQQGIDKIKRMPGFVRETLYDDIVSHYL